MEPPVSKVVIKKQSNDFSLPPLLFGEGRSFETELHRRVDEYFSRAGIPRTATVGVYLKALFVVALFATTYLLLVFIATTLWQGLLLAILLGFSMVEIGVNVQHDGAHNAYSSHPWVNRIMAMTVDLIGASSYFWRWKHNRIHHTYTNIAPYDTDINLGILARIAPSSRRLWFHRWQHLYLWPFYGLMVIKWQLFDDFYNAIKGRLGRHQIPRPKQGDLFVFIMGKTLFFSLAFVVPLIFHPFWRVIFFYGLTMVIEGMTLSLIFILPHGVGEAEFPVPQKDTGRLPYPRAVHQVRVTVDFMRNNPVVTWLVGGLNLHREHHLFPAISHVHYPAIVGIVDEVCGQFGIRPVNHHSYIEGLKSHYRWLRRMGAPDGAGIS